jgi:anti-sigma factor RsiW
MSPIGEDDLQAYIDGRLAPERQVAIEAYLAENPEHAAHVARDRQLCAGLRAALASKATEPLPPRLRIAEIRAGLRYRRLRQWRLAAAFAGVLLVGAGSGWALRNHWPEAPETNQLASGGDVSQDALIAYRTFVGEKRHAVEVGANEEAHLVNWLSKRLGRKLLAPDLDGYGFHLMGGRLLPAGTRTSDGNVAAAQFMYESADGRRMTLYVRAGSGAETAFRYQQAGDIGTFAWIDQGFGYAVTGQGDRAELLPIAEAVYQAYEAAP